MPGQISYVDGIQFPAVQVPSTDLNRLDDYEENTWTPVLKFGGGVTGITYGTQSGVYTKIGNMVFVSFLIDLTSKGSSTGNATIAGLPFTVGKDCAASFFAGGISYVGMLQGFGSGTSILLYQITEGGVASALSDGNFINTSNLRMSLSYQV